MQKLSSDGVAGRAPYFLSTIAAAVLWGFLTIPLRELQHWPADTILFYRILASTGLIWGFILIFRKEALRRDLSYFKNIPAKAQKKLVLLTISAGLLLIANWYTFIIVVNSISIQAAGFAYLICPLLTTVAAYFILRESLSKINKIALIIAALSVIMLAQGSLLNVLWSFSIAIFYAFYLIIQRVVNQIDKLNFLALQLTISSFVILPFVLAQQESVPSDTHFWLNINIIAVFFTVIPLYLNSFALNRISSATVGVILYINPIITFLMAILFFNEQLLLNQLFSYLLLLFAVVLFNWNTIIGFAKARKTESA